MVSSRRNRSVQDSRTIPTDHFPVLASRIQPEAEITVTAITLNGSPSVCTLASNTQAHNTIYAPGVIRSPRGYIIVHIINRHGCLDANLHPRSRQLRRSGTYATFTNGLISAATRIPHSSYRQRSIQLAHHSYRTKSNRIHERSLHWTNRNLHQPHISHTK